MTKVADKTSTQKQLLIILTSISGILVLPPILFFFQFLFGSFPAPLARLTARLHEIYNKNYILTAISVVCILSLRRAKVADNQTGLRIAKITAIICNSITLITVQRLYDNSSIQNIIQPVVTLVSSVPLWQSILIGIVLVSLLVFFIWLVRKVNKDPIPKPAPAGNGYPSAGYSGGTPEPSAEGYGGTSSIPPKEKGSPSTAFDSTESPSIINGLYVFLFLIIAAGIIYSLLCLSGLIDGNMIPLPIVVLVTVGAWMLLGSLKPPTVKTAFEKLLDLNKVRNLFSIWLSLGATGYLFISAINGDNVGSHWWSGLTNLLRNDVLASFVFLPFLFYYIAIIVQTFLDLLLRQEDEEVDSVANKIRKTVENFEKNLIQLVEILLNTTLDRLNKFIEASVSSTLKVFFEIDDETPKQQ